jgi:hypothetical protein
VNAVGNLAKEGQSATVRLPDGRTVRWRLSRNGVAILNMCAAPDPWADKQIDVVLHAIDSSDLGGLRTITLICELTAADPESPSWYQAAQASGRRVRGWYKDPAFTGELAEIVLHVPGILGALPRVLWRTPAATMLIAGALGHEIGHHVMRSAGLFKVEYDAEEERMADRYALDLRRRMSKRLRYRLGEWLIKEVASWLYIQGLSCWKHGEHDRAVLHWRNSLVLDPNHGSAKRWLWHALHGQADSAENKPESSVPGR